MKLRIAEKICAHELRIKGFDQIEKAEAWLVRMKNKNVDVNYKKNTIEKAFKRYNKSQMRYQ